MNFDSYPKMMMKEGSRYLSGTDEVILRNIEAVKKLSQMLRTSLGPNGNNNNYDFDFF